MLVFLSTIRQGVSKKFRVCSFFPRIPTLFLCYCRLFVWDFGRFIVLNIWHVPWVMDQSGSRLLRQRSYPGRSPRSWPSRGIHFPPICPLSGDWRYPAKKGLPVSGANLQRDVRSKFLVRCLPSNTAAGHLAQNFGFVQLGFKNGNHNRCVTVSWLILLLGKSLVNRKC